MKEFMSYGWYIALALIGLIIVFVVISQHRGSMNESKFADTFTAIDTKAEVYESKAFSVNIQDPNYGGDYILQRCPAMESKKDTILFEDDVNGYFKLSTTHQDTLTLATGAGYPGTGIPACTVGSGGKAFDDKHTVVEKGLTQKQIGLPAIVPKVDEIKQHILLGMLSLKESTLEKELTSKQTVMGIKKDELLNAIFTDEFDASTKQRKGLIGLQLMSSEVIKAALGDKQERLKNYIVFAVSEVKSEEEMKNTIKALAGFKGTDEQMTEVIAGLRHLKEGDTVIMPQKAKALVKDKEGAGKFTATGRMKRN